MGVLIISFPIPGRRSIEFSGLAALFAFGSLKLHIPHAENPEIAAL